MTGSPRDSFIVEFVGMAGVGKTAMAAALVELLRGRALAANPLPGLPMGLSQKLQLRPLVTAARIVGHIRPNLEKTSFRLFCGLYKDLVKLTEARRRGGLWVSDQGIVQRVSTLHKHSAAPWSSAWIELTRQRCFHPDLLVRVRASRDQLDARRQARDGAPPPPEFYDQAKARGIRMGEDLERARQLDPERDFMIVQNQTSDDLQAGALMIFERIRDRIPALAPAENA